MKILHLTIYMVLIGLISLTAGPGRAFAMSSNGLDSSSSSEAGSAPPAYKSVAFPPDRSLNYMNHLKYPALLVIDKTIAAENKKKFEGFVNTIKNQFGGPILQSEVCAEPLLPLGPAFSKEVIVNFNQTFFGSQAVKVKWPPSRQAEETVNYDRTWLLGFSRLKVKWPQSKVFIGTPLCAGNSRHILQFLTAAKPQITKQPVEWPVKLGETDAWEAYYVICKLDTKHCNDEGACWFHEQRCPYTGFNY